MRTSDSIENATATQLSPQALEEFERLHFEERTNAIVHGAFKV
jgi:hypothetical protein